MLEALIKDTSNRKDLNEIINYVGADPKKFKELVHYFLGNNVRISQKTSWAVGHIGELQPQLLEPYHTAFIDALQNKQNQNAIRRNIVRFYQFVTIPEEFEGKLYTLSLNFILDTDEAIAIKAFSMRICERIAIKYKELIPELIQAIESVLPHASSGLKNRGKHILQNLAKI